VATKKGKREGTTEFAQRSNPDFTAGRLLWEKMSSPIVKVKNSIGNKFLFNFMT
jgi:hypothetical protein